MHRTLPVAGSGLPTVMLLDADAADLDLAGLQAWARSLADERAAPFVVRSYCFPYALVAWHDAPVGIDIERHDSYPAGFAATICTPDELHAAPGHADLTALWCAKEALAKALGDALQYDPRLLQAPLCWPAGQAGRWRATALAVPAGHVAWLCWRRRAAATPGGRSHQNDVIR